MKTIINTKTCIWPISEGQYRAAFPNTSFPSELATLEEPFAWVESVSQPKYDWITQGCRSALPVQQNGVFTQQYDVYDLPAEQIDINRQIHKERLISGAISATQNRLDAFAQSRGYDGILSLCTYATSTVPKFQAEGQYGVTARDATWAQLYTIMAEVESGARPMPEGYSDIESELPVLAWPI